MGKERLCPELRKRYSYDKYLRNVIRIDKIEGIHRFKVRAIPLALQLISNSYHKPAFTFFFIILYSLENMPKACVGRGPRTRKDVPVI